MTTTHVPDRRKADGEATEPAPDDAATPGAADGSAVPPDARRRQRIDPAICVAAALVLVPTIAAMVSALRNPWAPTNDWALLELQVRDVGTGDTPLVGAWSRFPWDHPGPLMFYALAAFYRLVPAEHGLLFAAAAVNFVAVAGAAAVTLTHTRGRALVTLACLALLQLGLGIAGLSDPWNPTLPILPFALYALVCVEIARGGRRWALPVAAGLAAFVVQAHVGFAPAGRRHAGGCPRRALVDRPTSACGSTGGDRPTPPVVAARAADRCRRGPHLAPRTDRPGGGLGQPRADRQMDRGR